MNGYIQALDEERRHLTRIIDFARAQLDAAERERIALYMQNLQNARNGDDTITIEGATADLGHVTDTFATRRMNRGIQQALAGKNIATL